MQMGVVTANKLDKTVTVLVERRLPHPVYKKYHMQSQKFLAHDPENLCNVGDKVRIVECRPLSRHKKWRLAEIIKRSE